MFLLLLAGLGTGRWEFYFIFAALFFLIIIAFVQNLWTFVSFSFRYELVDTRVTKGSSPTLKIYIHNNKPFTLNGVATIKAILPSEQTLLSIQVAPGNTECYEVKHDCRYRGIYEIGITYLEITDIFGILPMRFDLRRLLPHYPLTQLVVYPRLLQLTSPLLATYDKSGFKGLSSQRQADKGEEYFDSRLYRFGDPFKRVHRTLSARKRELYVKCYDIPTETSALIVVDACDSSLSEEDALHYSDIACESAATIANSCLTAGHAVAVACCSEDETVIKCNNSNDLPKLLDYLAIVKLDSGNACSALRLNKKNERNLNTVYVISSRNDDTFINTLTAFKDLGIHIRLFIPTLQNTTEYKQPQFSIEGITQTVITDIEDIASL